MIERTPNDTINKLYWNIKTNINIMDHNREIYSDTLYWHITEQIDLYTYNYMRKEIIRL